MDTENRTWIDVAAARAKVCYDPTDPGQTHRLVPGTYVCGQVHAEGYGG